MKSQFETDFQALHAAALTLATKMIASLQPCELEALENATKSGAIVLMQAGPMPACQRIELVLQEREGARHVLASIRAHHVD